MKNILLIRFSAFGDVALTVPVIDAILSNYPDVNLSILTRPFFKPLFPNHSRLTFIEADLYGKHKGAFGLKKLHSELKPYQFDAVVDLHDVIRTKILRTYFKLGATKVLTFDKGRNIKKDLVAGKIPFQQLPHTTSRYLAPFNQLELSTSIDFSKKWLSPSLSSEAKDFINSFNNKIIGIAPFAAKPSKEWGLNKIEELIKQLSSYTLLLFGAGERETKELEQLSSKHSNVINLAGKFRLEDELAIIDKLNVMVAMDSANMHLATLVQTPVVSIWGPTHHFLGFGPLNNEQNIVEIPKEELPCRPCSIFGNLKTAKETECSKKAMEQITIEMVLNKINSILNANQ